MFVDYFEQSKKNVVMEMLIFSIIVALIYLSLTT